MSRFGDRGDTGYTIALGRTTSATGYPTTAVAYYYITLLAVFGDESIGGSPSISTTSATIIALNIGYGVPSAGTTVICTRVKNRWVFRYDG